MILIFKSDRDCTILTAIISENGKSRSRSIDLPLGSCPQKEFGIAGSDVIPFRYCTPIWFGILKRNPDFKFLKQTLILIFESDPDWKLFIAIMIVIETLIRINQTMIWNSPSDHDWNISGRLWWKKCNRTLIEIFQADFDFQILSRPRLKKNNRTLNKKRIRCCSSSVHTPTKKQPDPAGNFSIGSWFIIFKQSLVNFFTSDFAWNISTRLWFYFFQQTLIEKK